LHPFSLVLADAHPALLWLTFFPSTDIVDKIIGMVPTYNWELYQPKWLR